MGSPIVNRPRSRGVTTSWEPPPYLPLPAFPNGPAPMDPMQSHPMPTSGVTTGWDANPLSMPVNIPPPEPIPGPPQRTPQTPLNPPRQTASPFTQPNIPPPTPQFGTPAAGAGQVAIRPPFTGQPPKTFQTQLGMDIQETMPPPPGPFGPTDMSTPRIPMINMPPYSGVNTNQPYPQMMPPSAPQVAPPVVPPVSSNIPALPRVGSREAGAGQIAIRPPGTGAPPRTYETQLGQDIQRTMPSSPFIAPYGATTPRIPMANMPPYSGVAPQSTAEDINQTLRRPTMGFQTEEEVSDAPLAYPPAKDPMEAEMEAQYPPEAVTPEDKELLDWAVNDLTRRGMPVTPETVAEAMQAEWNRRHPERPGGLNVQPFSTEYPKIFGEEENGPKSIGPPMPPPDTAPDTSGFTPGTVYTPTDIIQKHWPTAPPELTEEDEINKLLGKWKPETSMQERLTGLLNTMPQRPQDISNWRKLGSFMVGLGQGPEAQERATYAPFYRSIADWQAQFEPTSKAAQLENTGNINLRQLLHNEAMEKAANRRIANQEQAERRRQYTAEQKASIDRAKLEAANLKAQDANWEYVDNQQTGTVWMVHPRLGAKDTKIPHGEFSDLERAQWRRGDIETRARETAANKPRKWQYFYDYSEDPERPVYKRQDEETGEIEVVGMPRPPARPAPNGSPQGTTQIPPNTGSPVIGKPPSATQRQAGLETKVAEARAKWPEYSEHINWNDQTGLPEITPPSDPWFGNKKVPYDDATYQMITDYIFGTGKSTPVQGQNQQGNTRTTSRGTVVTRID